MSRPIGVCIRQVCEAVGWLGACGSTDVAAWTGLSRCDVSRYAGRAERHGLLKIDRTKRPHTYAAVHGWRYRVDDLKVATPVSAPNSVFQLGERAGATT